MTHKLDADDFFIQRVQQHCAEAGLNFFLVEPLWIEAFIERFQRGEIWARVLLNMHSEHHQPDEIYHRLVVLAAARHTQVIDSPDIALAAFNKAQLHPRLVSAGVPVPETIVVPREEIAAFRLSDAQRTALSSPFVIKPAMGYGRGGVMMNATSETDIAHSMARWPDTHYLLQRRVTPRVVNGEPVYFRVYFVFGSVWCCWWNCHTDHYRLPTAEERDKFFFPVMEEITRQIAALTGMKFFSSEIAQTESGEFVVIDYVNDQCHMLSQSSNAQLGVPDALVAAIARRLVEGARELIAQARK